MKNQKAIDLLNKWADEPMCAEEKKVWDKIKDKINKKTKVRVKKKVEITFKFSNKIMKEIYMMSKDFHEMKINVDVFPNMFVGATPERLAEIKQELMDFLFDNMEVEIREKT